MDSRRFLVGLISGILSTAIASFSIPAFSEEATIQSEYAMPKNVILMIGDGNGYGQIAAAGAYQNGTIGSLPYEDFPVRLSMSTYPSGGSYDPLQAESSFRYVMEGATDSAAAATAMATGTKTYNSAIGVDVSGAVLTNLSEIAENLGKATGVVTSVPISHATPASFIAHNVSRNDYSGIAGEMILSSKTDVIMGAGHPFFDNNGQALETAGSYQYVGSESIWQGLLDSTLTVADADGDGDEDPWTLVCEKEDFLRLASGDVPGRVFGLACVSTTLQQARDGDTTTPFSQPLNDSVPTLSDMSMAALHVLDQDNDGFFLMIEGGAIDWACASNQTGRLIEEGISFAETVAAVSHWVEQNSSWDETLLIVTADHETGYLTGPGSNPLNNPIVANGAGVLPSIQWNSGNHTNSLVPVYAKGLGSERLLAAADQTDNVRGLYIDNTELFDVIAYTPRMCTIRFLSQGGTSVETQRVSENSLIKQPENPTRKGYVFFGWFSDAEATDPWNFDTDRVSSDMSLFAAWKLTNSGMFVTRLYQICLEREPDQEGLIHWVDGLESKQMTGSEIVYGFVFSKEMHVRNLPDKEFVTMLYRALFGREPDREGLLHWTDTLASGMSRYYVLHGFTESDEFRSLCEEYDIAKGELILERPSDLYPQLTRFVVPFYRRCLNRFPDEAGLDNWVRSLANKTSSGTNVANGFFFSKEFTDRNVSDSEFLTILFQAICQRSPDPSGYGFWMCCLEQGQSREEVLLGFVHSQEFQQLCSDYGIKR